MEENQKEQYEKSEKAYQRINQIIFFGSLLTIIILGLANVAMWHKISLFDTYCIVPYEINQSCPCLAVTGPSLGIISTEDMSNITQKLLYTQNQSVS